jgi:uncharacterized protein (DUF2236 family)
MVRADDPVIGLGLLAGGANVIMQLSWPPVGYGVLESRVDSGNLFVHPVKRTRTTLTYLAVALLGTDRDRQLFRRAVNRSHARVRSTPDSPVAYDAFDPALQLWVAACLYRGVEDVGRVLAPSHSQQGEEEQRYQACSALATTLQVPRALWPKNRAAFDAYWEESLSRVRIDEPVREHLTRVARLEFLPAPVPQLFGGVNRFITTGFLPPPFREQMRFAWDDRDQRRWERLMRLLRPLVATMPGPVRRFPVNACLWDLRLRARLGRPLT